MFDKRKRYRLDEKGGKHELRHITYSFMDVLKAYPNGSIWVGYVQKIGQPMPRGEEGRRQMELDNIEGIYYARKTMAHVGRPSSVASALQKNADKVGIPKSKIVAPYFNNFRGEGTGIARTNGRRKNSQKSFYINEEPHNAQECYFRVYKDGSAEEISEDEAMENGVIGKKLGNIGGTNEDYRYILSNVAFISYNDTPTTTNKKGARIAKDFDYGQDDSEMLQNPMTWINADKINGDIPKEAIFFAIDHLANQGYVDRGGSGKKAQGTSKQKGEWVGSRLMPSAEDEGSYEEIARNSDLGSWDDEVDKNEYNARGKEARDMALRNGKRSIKNNILGTQDPMELQLAHKERKGHAINETKGKNMKDNLLNEQELNEIINDIMLQEGFLGDMWSGLKGGISAGQQAVANTNTMKSVKNAYNGAKKSVKNFGQGLKSVGNQIAQGVQQGVNNSQSQSAYKNAYQALMNLAKVNPKMFGQLIYQAFKYKKQFMPTQG